MARKDSFYSSEDIRTAEFQKSNFGGYKAEQVAGFLEEVANQVDALFMENESLKEKIGLLAKSVERYRSDEDSIRDAFISAQKVGEANVREARHKAEIIIKSAQEKAETIVAEAQRNALDQKDAYARLKEEAAAFRDRILACYREQLKAISALQPYETGDVPKAEAGGPVEQPQPMPTRTKSRTPAVPVAESPAAEPIVLDLPRPDSPAAVSQLPDNREQLSEKFIGLSVFDAASGGEQDNVFGNFKKKVRR